MSNQFRIGQKVVCAIVSICHHGEAQPKKGEIVTIRGIISTDRLRLLFEEYRNKQGDYGHGVREAAFAASGFRPLQEDLTEELARTWKESVPSEQEVKNPVPQKA